MHRPAVAFEYHPSRMEFTLKWIRSAVPEKILDVGFLGSDFPDFHMNLVKKIGSGCSVTGIDTNSSLLEKFMAHESFERFSKDYQVDYRLRSIYQSGFPDRKFDAVLLLEVLEHLDDPHAAVAEIWRILRPGGSLLITCPNPLSMRKLVSYFLQRGRLSPAFLAQFQGALDHKWFPHPACLILWLEHLRFSIHGLSFIKFSHRLKPLEKILSACPLTVKTADYIGIAAVKNL
ncbi:MAG: methyltransferase domain-containing protein [Candidatus Wallbacteria bacterium]|nr:methyltransferase domain-containing protein [Candidatus Wallbacteria bacterium]